VTIFTLAVFLGSGQLALGADAQELRDVIEVKVDMNRDVSGISSLIYGQFIEHMGRSVYGGLWAEMLLDRKFFHPVGKSRASGSGRSPWAPFGTTEDDTLVSMDPKQAYVGDWSVRIKAGGGIRHGELAFLEGKGYEGFVVAKAPGGEPCEVSVVISWGPSREDQAVFPLKIEDSWRKNSFRFQAGASTRSGSFSISVRRGTAWIGAASLMPADNIQGFRADTLSCLRTLGATIYRWPGGNFVSGYKWWEGIGERDKRPPFKNPAWPGFDQNDVGVDEFMTLVRILNAEPYIVVNAGLGTAETAADLVEYVNGAPDTEWGAKRAENGHPEPYRVRWWGIGNEMYGSWQLGHVPLKEYVKRHLRFAEAMRAVDPSIRIVAVGASGTWSRTMLREASGAMTLLSEHFYCKTSPDVLKHVEFMREAVRKKVLAHREACRAVFGGDVIKIPIALDEWNYSWQGRPHVYGPYGVQYRWRDGLGVAAALCEMIRNRRVIHMANFAQTINVIGAVKTTRCAAELETSALPLALFRHSFGSVGVGVSGDTGPLDVVAAVTKDRQTLTLAVLNPTDRWKRIKVRLSGAELDGRGEVFLISHPDPEAANKPADVPWIAELDFQKKSLYSKVCIETLPFLGMNLEAVPAAPLSLTLFRLGIGGSGQLPGGPFESLDKPSEGEVLVGLYLKGGVLKGAVSSDEGVTWRRVAEVPVEGTFKQKKIDDFSLCRGARCIYLIVSCGGKIAVGKLGKGLRVGNLTAVEIADDKRLRLSDPQLIYEKEKKTFLLLASEPQGKGSFVVASRSADPNAFPEPEPALVLGDGVAAGPVLPGGQTVLFVFDGRVGTYRMAVAGRSEGPYLLASGPLGRSGTTCAAAFVRSKDVCVFLKEADGLWHALLSPDGRSYLEAGGKEVRLPEEKIDRIAFVWVRREAMEGLDEPR